jgi:hypothetical protein
MDLLERIQLANKRSEQNNRKSAEAQAQLKLLTTQISELVANYEQKFGISFPNIEDEAKFTKFVNDLLATTEADLEQKVTVAEKVNQLILEGDILGAQELLGYEPEEEVVEELDAEEEAEGTEVELEDVEEVELEDIAPKRVIEDEPIVKPKAPVRKVVDDLEEEPIAPVKPATRRTVVSDDLEEEELVAPVKPATRRTIVKDDEEPLVKPAPRRTVVVEDEEPVAPVKPAPRRTVVSDDLDDLEETPVVRPRKSPIVTSNFDMDEDEDAGVSLKELNAVAGVAPRRVSPKAKSPVVMDDLEEEEIVVRPRKRAIIVGEDDSDDVAPARPVRSGGSFKFD